ncbi:MAG: YfiR family protein, partial [Methylococcaceae bacterium]
MINLAGVFFGLVLLLSQQVIASDVDVEYKVKAGYLYNFTKFITWPEDSSASFNLCIVGDDPFG